MILERREADDDTERRRGFCKNERTGAGAERNYSEKTGWTGGTSKYLENDVGDKLSCLPF